ncbi:MAG: 2-oxoacid:acceptor oxidoreductase family protein [Candidatus Accumulibacter sp.]|jgi:2-oxoglutarate ferredoxin oxidoreductase subunit gamma|nr:2-oxoacid:acceptor oxidoreductase family protein [Accumulibacter sp.]
MRREILISGFGGQGVVLAGRILGEAAVSAGLHASMLVSHGTETRGGYVRSQVVVADEEIDSPVVEKPDYFCAMSLAAYRRFAHLTKQGVIFLDPELVDAGPDETLTGTSLPARKLSVEQTGGPLAANMVMLGAVLRGLKIVPFAVAEQVARRAMPRHAEANARALRAGWSFPTD